MKLLVLCAQTTPKAPITQAMQDLALRLNGESESADQEDGEEVTTNNASGTSSWLNFWPKK